MLVTCMASTADHTALRTLVASQVGRNIGPKKEARGLSFANDRHPSASFE